MWREDYSLLDNVNLSPPKSAVDFVRLCSTLFDIGRLFLSRTKSTKVKQIQLHLSRETRIPKNCGRLCLILFDFVRPLFDLRSTLFYLARLCPCPTLFNFVRLCSTSFDFVRCRTKATMVKQSRPHLWGDDRNFDFEVNIFRCDSRSV